MGTIIRVAGAAFEVNRPVQSLVRHVLVERSHVYGDSLVFQPSSFTIQNGRVGGGTRLSIEIGVRWWL